MSLKLPGSTAENDKTEERRNRPIARSPQPYSRRSFEVPERLQLNRRSRPNPLELSADRFPQTRANRADLKSAPDCAKRRRNPNSPSDSGTEADDERPLLKALTAPPLRPRKGLRIAKGFAANAYASPLLTPSAVEEDEKTFQASESSAQRSKSEKETQQASARLRTKRRRHGRAELLRRTLETALLGLVSVICLQSHGVTIHDGKSALKQVYELDIKK